MSGDIEDHMTNYSNTQYIDASLRSDEDHINNVPSSRYGDSLIHDINGPGNGLENSHSRENLSSNRYDSDSHNSKNIGNTGVWTAATIIGFCIFILGLISLPLLNILVDYEIKKVFLIL